MLIVFKTLCVYIEIAPGVGARGDDMGPSEPGTLGQMESEQQSYSGYSGSFEDEPPLLQELGIDFELIKQKVSKGKYACEFILYNIL